MSIKAISWVLENVDECPEDKTHLVAMICLADWCDDEGVCYPGITKLAHKCRLKTPGGARRVMSDLEKRGQVYRDIGGGIQTPHGPTNRTYLCKYRASIGLPPMGDLVGKGNHLRSIGRATGAIRHPQNGEDDDEDDPTVQDGMVTPCEMERSNDQQTVQDGTVTPCEMEREIRQSDPSVNNLTVSSNRQSSSSVQSDRVDARADEEEEDENPSHSNNKPENGTPADLASLAQNSTLAELEPQPDATARPSDQVSSVSHSNEEPEITNTGRAKRGQNNSSSDLHSDARDEAGQNQDETASQEDAVSSSLCEGVAVSLEQVVARFEQRVGKVDVPRRNRLAGWLDEYGGALLVECIEATGDYEPKKPIPYLAKTLRDRQARLERLATHQEMLVTPLVAAEPVDEMTQLKKLAVIKGATHLMATDNANEWALYAMSHHEPPVVLVGYAYVNGSVPKPSDVAMNSEFGLDRIPEGAIEL